MREAEEQKRVSKMIGARVLDPEWDGKPSAQRI